jgi:uncharacterized protein YegP (UPF0339 family)
MRVVVFRSNKDSLFYIRFLGDNNEIVMSSEGHQNKGDAIKVAREYAPLDAVVEVRADA